MSEGSTVVNCGKGFIRIHSLQSRFATANVWRRVAGSPFELLIMLLLGQSHGTFSHTLWLCGHVLQGSSRLPLRHAVSSRIARKGKNHGRLAKHYKRKKCQLSFFFVCFSLQSPFAVWTSILVVPSSFRARLVSCYFSQTHSRPTNSS